MMRLQLSFLRQSSFCFRLLLLLLGASVCFAPSRSSAEGPSDREASDFFERRVRPLLVEHCLECHASETQENGLRLDSRNAILRGGERGAAVIPGNAEGSLLIQALRRGGELKMPPDAPLEPAEIAAFAQWIEAGIPWPDAPLVRSAASDSRPARRAFAQRDRHWAFKSIVKPSLPDAGAATRSHNPIDQFVNRQLKKSDLTQAPQANRRTLIRRLYFDLIGLPPTAIEVDTFVANRSSQAYEALVDELLARPEFGERWARHWLDIARYADTTGYQEGGERRYPFAWTYRDYVIRSFNEDTPYDAFIVEQLAADQLDLYPEHRWKLAAMGFLTVGPRFNYVRHEIIDDRIDVVTRGLMGLTVTCARCHDHKYDPLLTEDYYGLYGVFASSHEPLYTDLPRIDSSRGDFRRYRRFRLEVTRATREFEQFHARVHRRILHEMRALAGDYLRYLVQLMPEHRTVTQPTFETRRGQIRGPTPYGPGGIVRWQHYFDSRGDEHPVAGMWNRLAGLPKADFAERARSLLLDTVDMNPTLRRACLEASPRSMLDVASVYGEVLERIYREWTTYLELHPDAKELPEPASEALRQVLYADDSPIAMNEEQAHDCYTDGEFNRYMGLKRELDSLFVQYQDVAAPRAMVLNDREQLMQPRVFVRGNSTRPGDFVERRFLRAFPEVDDDESFPDGSGRLSLARAIIDPRNPLTARVIVNRVWQWHFGRGLVDTASDFGTRTTAPSHPELLDWLAADFVEQGWSLKHLHRQIVMSQTYRQSGTASDEAREVDPDNRLLSHMSPRRLDFESLRDALLAVAGRLQLEQGGAPAEELAAPRRSLYVLVNRDDPPGVFATFDFPSTDISTARRSETTVPQQALFLMNSDFTEGIAEHLVAMMRDRGISPQPSERIDWLYRHVLSRSAETHEIELATSLLGIAAGVDEFDTNADDRWRDLAQVLLMSNEFMFVD